MWFGGASSGEEDDAARSAPRRQRLRSLSPETDAARSPRAVSLLDTIPLVSGLMGANKTMELAVLNAATLLEGRVDPNLAAIDQAIPTWVISKAKARGLACGVAVRARARRHSSALRAPQRTAGGAPRAGARVRACSGAWRRVAARKRKRTRGGACVCVRHRTA
jgi:hypothetical protein